MDKKTGFDLSAIIGDVSNLDTGSTGTLMIIPAAEVHPNEKNFYDVSKVDSLVDSILMDGLQSPLVVNKIGEGNYKIISGHRRYAAITQIIEGKLTIRKGKLYAADIAAGNIPCLVNKYENELEAELALIRANSDTRVLTSAETAKQVERVEMLLYELKEQGYEFPGKMRDYVAEACKVSASKIARLKVIREKLIPDYLKYYDKGDLNESVAYALAKEPDTMQKLILKAYGKKDVKYLPEWKVKDYCEAHKKIFSIKCSDKTPCKNSQAMWDRYAEPDTYHSACYRCCKDCYDKLNCKAVCSQLRDKILEEKRKQRAENKSVKEKQQAKDDILIAQIWELWKRFGEARKAAGVSIEDIYKTLGWNYYSDYSKSKYEKNENGEEKLTAYSNTPYHDLRPQQIADIAELFGVSLEYLFCKTDDPSRSVTATLEVTNEPDEPWRRFGKPETPGYYIVLVDQSSTVSGSGKILYFNGQYWQHPVARINITPNVDYWTPCPALPVGIWETEAGA